ncbi:hypothetical protein EYC84_006911 [Monilinia fructicola]|uniref:Uncharacterized protein n=1 Tax=Monilinia fructicola TaxID=38448 RepID=A0A5M9K7M0_MONFR|nr:hypothetical protein EYC84_006911 [Monilinia fructicola]
MIRSLEVISMPRQRHSQANAKDIARQTPKQSQAQVKQAPIHTTKNYYYKFAFAIAIACHATISFPFP